MSFNEQVAIEVVKGGFTLLAVLLGAGWVARTVERYKGDQAVVTKLRRRQYEALGRVLEALGKFEDTFWTEAAKRKTAEWTKKPSGEARRACMAVITAHSYLLGPEVTGGARDVLYVFDKMLDMSDEEWASEGALMVVADQKKKALQDLLPSMSSLGAATRAARSSIH